MSRLLSVWVAALLTIALAPMAWAQPAQTGTVAGVVQDVSGGVLPGVTVTLTSQERGVVRSVVTDENGRYAFAAVSIGNYTVEANLAGFAPLRLTDNLVETEKTTNVPFALKVGGLTDSVTVTGETPIVDLTNVTANTRVRREEFERLPVGRSYQNLIGVTPGVVGTGNVNALGALTSSNLFIMDSVDTTDPTTGTFGANLNFEAIQEVSVSTSAASVEYGRGQGAIVNIITKSGTNRFEGSAKYIVINDNWDKQNSTKSEVTGVSLERAKFDKVNPVYATTLGGPLLKDRAWFFAAHEYATNTTPQRQTSGPIPENYQQSTENNFLNVRATVQISDGHSAWVKYFRSPNDWLRHRLLAGGLGRGRTGSPDLAEPELGFVGRAVERRAQRQLGGGSSGGHLHLAARRHHLRGRPDWLECPGVLPGGQPQLQRRHLRRLHESSAPAGQPGQHLVLQSRLA